jgi:hypothetical protein
MMNFRIEHAIAADLGAVEALVLDRETLLKVKAISPIGYRAELVRHRDTGEQVERVARFSARGVRALTHLPLVPDNFEWMDRLLWTRSTHRASFVIDPFLTAWLRPRVSCSGEYRLSAEASHSTRRTVEGKVRVDVPVFGGLLERAVVGLAERHFEAEARFLEGRGPLL